jgi:hypothetical protein
MSRLERPDQNWAQVGASTPIIYLIYPPPPSTNLGHAPKAAGKIPLTHRHGRAANWRWWLSFP